MLEKLQPAPLFVDRRNKLSSLQNKQVKRIYFWRFTKVSISETNEILILISDIPTAIYNNLRFQNYTLTWDAPKDCSTISGPIIAKIIVTGISEAVKNFSITMQTAEYSYYLNDVLHGAEIYEARIYAIRNYTTEKHNESRYEKLIFITPPKG